MLLPYFVLVKRIFLSISQKNDAIDKEYTRRWYFLY